MNAQLHTPADRRLSVAMIVRDEQDVLPETIHSIRPIADEIVVVDTGSTDQTCRVATQLSARVVAEPWKDDFAAARNRMLAEAQGDWILWLNAGEQMTPDSALKLRQFVDREVRPHQAYALMVQFPPSDPSVSAEQMAQPRLLPKRTDVRFEGRVRETVLPSMAAAGLELALAPATILRHAREHDPRRKAAKAQRNLRLIDLERHATANLSARTLLALGDACADLGQSDGARQVFLEAKRTSARGSTEMLEAYYGLLTTFDGRTDLRDQQLATCLEALEIYPLDAQLLCAIGSYLQARNQLDLAARSFRLAMEHGQVNLETWHLADIDQMAVTCLGLTLQLQGKDDEARLVFEEALSRHSRSTRILRHLINVCVKLDREPDALALVDRIPRSNDFREAFRQAVLGACRASKKDWTPALAYLQSAYAAGCDDPFCLRWLSVTLLSNGQVAAAMPVLEHWRLREPANSELAAYLKAIADDQESRRLRFDTPSVPSDSPAAASHSAPKGRRGAKRGK